MPSRISVLISVCEELTSGKALERKKAGERFKDLLVLSDVQRQLDKTTNANVSFDDSFGFTWSRVFEAADGALAKELKSQRSSSSASAAKKPEMYGVVKCVLAQSHGRTIQDGRAVIDPEVIFSHMWVILSDYSHLLASEYAYLLVYYFLSDDLWRQWGKPDLNLLSKMLTKLIKGLAKSAPGFNADKVSQAIRKLSVLFSNRIDIRPMKFLSLFKDFFLQTQESNSQTLENMLVAVNAITGVSAANCRLRLSQFGSDVAMKMLQLWQANAKDNLKIAIIGFFRLQVVLHEDDDKVCPNWQNAIWKLYELMFQEIGNKKDSHRVSSEKSSPVLTEDFINLFGHVCLMLLSDDVRLNEVSQMASQSNTYSAGRPSKRRKVQSGWDCIKSELENTKDSNVQIAWIRVIKVIVQLSTENSFSDEQLNDVLNVMCKVLAETKRPTVLVEVHGCLCVLATQSRLLAAAHDKLWRKVVAYSISLVERKISEFYSLLTILIKLGKQLDQAQLVSLIKHSIASPQSTDALKWLVCYLSRYELGLCPILTSSEMEIEFQAPALKPQEHWQHTWLANQLLQIQEDDEGLYRVVSSTETVSPVLFGQLMAAIVCKEPVDLSIKETTNLVGDSISQVKELYNSMKFKLFSTHASENSSTELTTLQPVAAKVASLLKEKTNLFCGLLGLPDIASSYIEDCVWLLEMLVTFFGICKPGELLKDVLPSIQALCTGTVDYIILKIRQRDGGLENLLFKLLSMTSTNSDILFKHCADDMKKLSLSVVSHINVLMESCTPLSQSSVSSSASRHSSMDDDFVTPMQSSGFIQQLDNAASSSQPKPSQHQIATSMEILVFITSSIKECRGDVIALLAKLCTDATPGHARSVIHTMQTALSHWLDSDHGIFLTFLFHTRALVESYHTDPNMGVACLQLINKLIPKISLTPHLTAEEKVDLGSKLYVIINGLILQLFDRRDEDDGSYELFPLFGVGYRLAFIDCLIQLIEAENVDNWRLEAGRSAAITLDPQDLLIKCLLDRDYRVRRQAVQSISVLFKRSVNGRRIDSSTKDQQISFDKIYTNIHRILAMSSDVDELERRDEESTRTATLLSLFQNIILSSAACRTKAMCALFLCLDESNLHINSNLIRKVLEGALPHSPYSSVAEMCESSLGYLAKEWISQKYNLSQFPVDLFDESDATSFYKKRLSTFAPLALGNEAVWAELTELAGIKEHEIVSSQLPAILLEIIPPLANSTVLSRQSKTLFEKCTNSLASAGLQMLGVMQDKLPDILAVFYSSVWDASDNHPNEPEPCPPYFSSAEIAASITYLFKMFHKKGVTGSSLLGVLAAVPSSVSKLHLQLALQLVTTKHSYELRQRCTTYTQFVSDLLPELKTSLQDHRLLFTECIIAVILNTVSTLGDQVQRRCTNTGSADTVSYITTTICELIRTCHTVFNHLVTLDYQVLASIVPRLTYHLITSSKSSDVSISTASTDLLTNIWTSHGDKFGFLVEEMEPSVNQYIPLNNTSPSLTKMMQMFMQSSQDRSHDHTHLLNCINTQLDTLDAKSIRLLVSGNGTTKLPQFTYALLRNINTCTATERAERLSCLGRLGTQFVSRAFSRHHCTGENLLVDQSLRSLALEYGDENDERDYIILSHILHYLLHDRQEVMQVCDRVLAQIFGSKAGDSVRQSLTRIGEGTEHMAALVSSYTSIGKKVKVPPAQSPEGLLSHDIWTSYHTTAYDEWVTSVTRAVVVACKTDILRLLCPLCLIKREFSELVLPYLLHDILSRGDKSLRARISSIFTHILSDVISKKEQQHTSVTQRVVSTLLNVVQFLRTKQNKLYYPERIKVHTAWHNNFWLDVDYALLAQAALFVKNYAMAALYAEIRLYQARDAITASLPPFPAQSLMIQVYSAIDDIDMLCGWGVSKLEDTNSRLTHYNQGQNWSRALQVNDSMLSDNIADPLSHSFESLRSSGLSQLLDVFLESSQSASTISDSNREMRYQQAWSNMQWDKLPTVTRLSHQVGFHECMFMATKSLVNDVSAGTTVLLDHMSGMCERSLIDTGHVLGSRVTESLANLELVQVLRDVIATRRCSDEDITSAVIGWQKTSNNQVMLSDSLNSQSALRTEELKVILRGLASNRKGVECEPLNRYLVDSVVSLSSQARQSNWPSMSEIILSRFRRLHPDLWGTECELESAAIYWAFEESERAMYVMKKCMTSLQIDNQEGGEKDSTKLCLYSRALRMYGSWLTSTRLEGPDTIADNYLQPAVQMAECSGVTHELEEAYHALAEFADNEYERLRMYMTSSEFESKLSLHRIQLEQEDELNRMSDKSRYRNRLRCNMEMNEAEINATKSAFVTNMHRALRNHILSMKSGSKHDLLSVFRVVAIWFDNETREGIREIIKEHLLDGIPSYKFLPLMCQLTARLSDEPSDLQTSLAKLILTTGKDHPHHVVPMLFALKCAATDLSGRSAQKETKSRASMAKNILKLIGKEKSQMIKEYNALTEHLIVLANNNNIKDKLHPASCKLVTLSSLQHTHVLTHTLQPRQSCDYSDIPHVYKYESKCSIAGGINRPKIIKCVGSDGKVYKQLCKGKDDTRQDAMMQQVFSLVNELLHSDQSTRSLAIRTYKVVPLSQRSGLLEWCVGTLPMGTWLGSTDPTYRNGAHCRYQPQGPTIKSCRDELYQMQQGSLNGSYTEESFLNMYNQLCKKIPPLFRHFFLERFTQPEQWLAAREKYSQSVALTSMVGYILGIGDRHTNNILIDENTGELVHIDFGVAFEQGKALGTPEIIPFRLTRTIIDGLGPTGVNGAFRRCCEKTMKVLRRSGRVINTILQVLIDDPILEWTLSAEKLERMQTEMRPPAAPAVDSLIHPSLASQSVVLATQMNSSINAAAGDVTINGKTAADNNSKHQQATNALLLVRNKLRGFEQNSHLSVSGQVNYLIQQAVDPNNLARMYAGWQPYL